MSETLDRRVRQHRARMQERAFDYRQRNLSRGVWFRLRRVLADAREAFVISPDDAQRLLAAGCRPEPVGDELAPAKCILFASSEDIAQLASARPIAVRLTPDMLGAECLALVRFEAQAAT